MLGASSMWIYKSLAPQKKIDALKITIVDAQMKLRKYDGVDPGRLLRLAAAAIVPALHQFFLIAGPTVAAILPVILVGGWLNHRYAGQMMVAIGPRWTRSWEVPFTIAVSLGALMVKLMEWKRTEVVHDEAFKVTLGTHLMSGAVHNARPLWRALGNIETRTVHRQFENVPIVKPLYVAGLARSGTSVLIEILASHPTVATHQYRDFPFLFIPYWWRQTLQRSSPAAEAAAERAHGDRLMVTAQSPEAMEEMLWMSFFSQAHRTRGGDALDESASNPAFEKFYHEHLQKLLLISGKKRYAAKGNYNLTRMAYLQKLFPDARFILPIRHPRDHIASLMKQHQLFCKAASKFPRSVSHLDRVGHFEFGVHRRCINPYLDPATAESIEMLWRSGEEVRGWARYWAMLYGWIDHQLKSSDRLRDATLIIKYESLCDQPAEMLEHLLTHCDLKDAGNELVKRWAPLLSRPTYYSHSFDSKDERSIDEEAGAVASEWGYS